MDVSEPQYQIVIMVASVWTSLNAQWYSSPDDSPEFSFFKAYAEECGGKRYSFILKGKKLIWFTILHFPFPIDIST